MVNLHRVYEIALDIELVGSGEKYYEARDELRQKLQYAINEAVREKKYKTTIQEEWEEEIEKED